MVVFLYSLLEALRSVPLTFLPEIYFVPSPTLTLQKHVILPKVAVIVVEPFSMALIVPFSSTVAISSSELKKLDDFEKLKTNCLFLDKALFLQDL